MIFTRIETVSLEGNNTLNVYQDQDQNTIAFRDCDQPFVYILNDDRTSPCYRNKKMLEAISNKYVEQGIRQHEYKGGFEEAVKVLVI